MPYTFDASGLTATLPAGVIDIGSTPHLALVSEDEPGPGGTTRILARNWEPPDELPHDVEIVARDAQHLVGDVDHHHVLDADGNLKSRWRDGVLDYLTQASAVLTRRRASALILGCTHFEYFTREFDRLLPSLAARGGIVSPSGALAWELLSVYRDHRADTDIHPITDRHRMFAGFSGDTPTRTAFAALSLDRVTLYQHLAP